MIKPGVDLHGLQPQMTIAYTIACAVYAKHEAACVITSAFDSVHGLDSLHKRDGLCRALDLRTNNLVPAMVSLVHRDLKLALGDQFDVIMEEDHIHVEYDPKEV